MSIYSIGFYLILVLWIFVLSVLRYKDRNSHRPDSNQDQSNNPNQNATFRRVYVINSNWDAEEREHRHKEGRFWRRYFVAYILTFIATAGGAIFAYLAYKEAKSSVVEAHRQAEYAQAQLSIAHRPKLKIVAAQAWNEGQGGAFIPGTQPPTIKAGQPIDGSLDLNNVGDQDAIVTDSDLIVSWLDALPMHNPIGDPHPANTQRVILGDKLHQTLAPESDPANGVIRPGGTHRWEFHTVVPPNIGPSGPRMCLIGHATYQDRDGTHHGLFFVRWYDPERQRFVRNEKPDEEYEVDE